MYGSEDKAKELLKIIDDIKSDKLNCPERLLEITKSNYEVDPIYKGVIDEMCCFINENISLDQVDYISGGERRDWFFSLILAYLLKKPHISIFKDLDNVVTKDGKTQKASSIPGKKVLHIADLITEASSYERAWIPSIGSLGADIVSSLVVVDRKQGGAELLSRFGVKSFSMVNIDKNMFGQALSMGLINKEQFAMLERYIADPKGSMRDFLQENPQFMENALKSDEKTRERAKICLEKGFYL